jgi:hypothetical protein
MSAGMMAAYPSGHQPESQAVQLQQQGGGYSSSTAVSQLFARLAQEIEENRPKNCIHFIVDFLCKHYPEHLHGFASIWQMDPDLERERHEVVNFFKAHKISTAVAAHFTNAGYDTIDTLTTISPDSLVDIEAFNNVKWLPGHKVRLQQIFREIEARVRAYKQQTGTAQQQQHRRAGSPHMQLHRHSYEPSYVHHLANAPTVTHSPALAGAAAYGASGHAALAAQAAAAIPSAYSPSLLAPGALGAPGPGAVGQPGNIFLKGPY